MNIEQIAQEVQDSFEVNSLRFVDNSEATEFLRRCLSKMAEQMDMEPVAYYDPDLDCGSAGVSFDPLSGGLNLYTETQLLAAQQKVAEACAKVCEKEAVQIIIDGPEERAYNNAVSDCAAAVRNGEWRKYL